MKYLILGAGPAGLSVALALSQLHHEQDFLVLEAEGEAGGLCRSADIGGAPVDTGGGHFLDVRNPAVNRFLFQFMPETEWNLFTRDSRIRLHRQLIGHPLEANIWQFDTDRQVAYLMSIAHAGCVTGAPMPESFVDWIRWKLGDRIADEYMLPYNRKMFGDMLDDLGTYWLEKLPDVSFEETLRACLQHRLYGRQPGHAQFYYPKRGGYGELWRRMAETLDDKIVYHAQVQEMDFERRSVKTADGSEYSADIIITSVPWVSVQTFRGLPKEMRSGLQNLKHTSVVIDYRKEPVDTKAHWIYEPDPATDHHRILVCHNFCDSNPGHWTETRKERFRGETDTPHTFLNEYAYPLNTIGKPQFMERFLAWCSEKKVYGTGRWGEHEHFNSDVVVDRALRLAEKLSGDS